MIHRGKIFEKRIRTSEKSISEVARGLGFTARHMYNLFDQQNLSLDIIMRTGRIIHYDFAEDIPEIKKLDQSMLEEDPAKYDSKYSQCIEEKNKIRESYFHQLQANNELLTKYVALMENKLIDYARQLPTPQN